MKLIHWHPVTDYASECVTMQREIDRMFERFRGGISDEGQSRDMLPVVDVVERENDFIVNIELPGVRKEDVKITVHHDTLTVRGEKKFEKEKTGETLHRMERSYGSFQRSFTLPATIRNDQIEASHENGILRIVLPKAEEAKPKDIEVKVK